MFLNLIDMEGVRMRNTLLSLLLKGFTPRSWLEPNCIRVLISKSKRDWTLQRVRGS